VVAGKCVQLLDKADKKVAEQAQKMLGELVKYMGKPCLLFALGKLNDKDGKALEAKMVHDSLQQRP
jgi:predicted permease